MRKSSKMESHSSVSRNTCACSRGVFSLNEKKTIPAVFVVLSCDGDCRISHYYYNNARFVSRN